MLPQRLDFGDALSVVGGASQVFVVIGLMRQTALAWMIGEPGARQFARGGGVAIVQELNQGERATTSGAQGEIMEKAPGWMISARLSPTRQSPLPASCAVPRASSASSTAHVLSLTISAAVRIGC